MRFAHVMLRVSNLDKAIDFYTNILGMNVISKDNNNEYKYTLAFLGYGELSENTVLELTYNWGDHEYHHGNAFGHLCMEVDDVYATCESIKAKGGIVTREAGPVKGGTTIIAFIKDVDGYQIELIQKI